MGGLCNLQRLSALQPSLQAGSGVCGVQSHLSRVMEHLNRLGINTTVRASL